MSGAAQKLAALQAELRECHSALRAGAGELASAGSAAFEAWAAYSERCRRRIKSLGDQIPEAQKALALQQHKMMEAHRNLRVLENLKRDEKEDWNRELDRETGKLADESFHARLLSVQRLAPRAAAPAAPAAAPDGLAR